MSFHGFPSKLTKNLKDKSHLTHHITKRQVSCSPQLQWLRSAVPASDPIRCFVHYPSPSQPIHMEPQCILNSFKGPLFRVPCSTCRVNRPYPRFQARNKQSAREQQASLSFNFFVQRRAKNPTTGRPVRKVAFPSLDNIYIYICINRYIHIYIYICINMCVYIYIHVALIDC